MRLRETEHILFVLMATLIVCIPWGCSRRREAPTGPASPHVVGWLDPGSPSFHGPFVERDGGPHLCASCHTVSQTDPATFCFECHYGPSGAPHSPTWADSLDPQYHGNAVYSYGYDPCKTCHGDTASNFSGGNAGVGCHSCHSSSVHGFFPDRWKYGFSDSHWHGKQVGREGFSGCASCHGATYDYSKGGIGRGCLPCHPVGRQWGAIPHAGPNWAQGEEAGPDTTHAYWVQVQQGGSSANCAYCHFSSGHSWRDGRSVPTCQSCHGS